MKHTFSPDVLAANPDLKIKSSKAKTPSGKGHGHTDDAQDYPFTTPTPRAMFAMHMQQALGHLEWFVPKCECGDGVEVKTARWALENLLILLKGES